MAPSTKTFPRHLRLLTPIEFKRVFKRSRRSSDDFFLVRARYADQPDSRLGLAISKRNARFAVQRNRIKRCTREAFRQLRSELACADYVVVNQPAAANASRKVLSESLTAHFQTLGRKKSPTAQAD